MKKVINILLVIVLLASTAALGWITYGYRDWNVQNWRETIKQIDKAVVTVDSNQNIKFDVINSDNLLLSVGEATTTSDGSVSHTIVATVYPAEASDKNVDWTIFWKNEGEFESTNIVTDYATVLPEADGSTIATITCVQGFRDHPIVVKVTTRDGLFGATCNLTFEGLPTAVGIYYGGYTGLVQDAELEWGETYLLKHTNRWNDVNGSAYGEGIVGTFIVETTIKNEITFGMYNNYYDNPERNFTTTYVPAYDEWREEVINAKGLNLVRMIDYHVIYFSNLSGKWEKAYSLNQDGLTQPGQIGNPAIFEDGVMVGIKYPIITSIANPENLVIDVVITSTTTGLKKQFTLTGDIRPGASG